MKYTHRELHEAVRALEKSYQDTLELTPADTVAHFLKAVGEALGKTTVAILIKRNAWDGRISRRSSAAPTRSPSAIPTSKTTGSCFAGPRPAAT